MLFGKNPPEISYLGLSSEFGKSPIVLNSYPDLISLIINSCKFNLSLDIKIVCLDASELIFSPSFFNTVNCKLI
jgi:hypothetical protein